MRNVEDLNKKVKQGYKYTVHRSGNMMATKRKKEFSTSPVTKEENIKTTLIHHFGPIIVTKIDTF